jgi:hypothetical protein
LAPPVGGLPFARGARLHPAAQQEHPTSKAKTHFRNARKREGCMKDLRTKNRSDEPRSSSYCLYAGFARKNMRPHFPTVSMHTAQSHFGTLNFLGLNEVGRSPRCVEPWEAGLMYQPICHDECVTRCVRWEDVSTTSGRFATFLGRSRWGGHTIAQLATGRFCWMERHSSSIKVGFKMVIPWSVDTYRHVMEVRRVVGCLSSRLKCESPSIRTFIGAVSSPLVFHGSLPIRIRITPLHAQVRRELSRNPL